MDKLSCQVLTVGDVGIEGAIDLLSRFFCRREFFRKPFDHRDEDPPHDCCPFHWVDLVCTDKVVVGVVTATTMLYIEWGG
jgi:hypothetical protein